jgi:hypothetical protein
VVVVVVSKATPRLVFASEWGWVVSDENPTPGSHLQARGVGWVLAGVSRLLGVIAVNKNKKQKKKHLYPKKHVPMGPNDASGIVWARF